jgi:hypothetical protein
VPSSSSHSQKARNSQVKKSKTHFYYSYDRQKAENQKNAGQKVEKRNFRKPVTVKIKIGYLKSKKRNFTRFSTVKKQKSKKAKKRLL